MRPQTIANLVGFLEAVESRVDEAILAGSFEESQREQLLSVASQYRPRTRRNPLGDPLTVFYLIARAHKPALDEQALELGCFCRLYLLALDLLDDVQDDDLSGKPHARVGAGMAINDALTLLFLGLSALERCMRLEQSPPRRLSYLKIVNRVALTTGRGQHVDLLGDKGARTKAEVLDMQRNKTASLTLLCECAALYAGVSEGQREHYRALGENLSLLVQILDDVRDVYGKRRSPDLETGKMTYPLACFFESANHDQRQRFEQLKASLPDSLPEIRKLFYDAGTLRDVASSMDGFRRAMHHEVAALGEQAATHRLLLFVIDKLVDAVYTPKPVSETAALREPRSGFHAHVRRLAEELGARLQTFGMPRIPGLAPWHQPQWMYEKRRGVVYYPDIEGLPEETLPLQAALLGEPDLAKVAQLVWVEAPVVIAHELFHYYRDVVGQLSTDTWHEELVANRLAVAYLARFEPAALAAAARLADRVLSTTEQRLTTSAEMILKGLLDPGRPPQPDTGYDLEPLQAALVQVAMLRELARAPDDLHAAIDRLLPRGRVAA